MWSKNSIMDLNLWELVFLLSSVMEIGVYQYLEGWLPVFGFSS